jgi:hypothetical protein
VANVSLQKYLKIILITGAVLVVGSGAGVYFIYRAYNDEKAAVEKTRDDIAQSAAQTGQDQGPGRRTSSSCARISPSR